MEEVKVSVVVPAYQGAKYLERCLRSILGQTLAGIEVIVVDDGSIDETEEVVWNCLGNRSNSKYIWQGNQGILRTKERSMAHIRGRYTLFVDQDDWLVPWALERLYEKAEAEEADLVHYAHYLTDEGSSEAIPLEEEVMTWSKLIRSSCLRRLDFSEMPSIDFFEDALLSAALSFLDPKKAYVEEPLYHHYLNLESVTHSGSVRCIRDALEYYRYTWEKSLILGRFSLWEANLRDFRQGQLWWARQRVGAFPQLQPAIDYFQQEEERDARFDELVIQMLNCFENQDYQGSLLKHKEAAAVFPNHPTTLANEAFFQDFFAD